MYAAKKFNVDSRDILIELGKRDIVGGQDDMIIDLAVELAKIKLRYKRDYQNYSWQLGGEGIKI